MGVSNIDKAIAEARVHERKCIIRYLRDQAAKQSTYDKIDLLNQMACNLEGTDFVPDGKLGSDYKGVTK